MELSCWVCTNCCCWGAAVLHSGSAWFSMGHQLGVPKCHPVKQRHLQELAAPNITRSVHDICFLKKWTNLKSRIFATSPKNSLMLKYTFKLTTLLKWILFFIVPRQIPREMKCRSAVGEMHNGTISSVLFQSSFGWHWNGGYYSTRSLKELSGCDF